MVMKNYRHGDLALCGIDKLPENLEVTKTNILMEGKTASHRFKNGDVYLKEVNEHVFGYFVATKDTVLLHTDHGEAVKGRKIKEAKVQKGVYELRRQTEDTNEGLKPVID